MRSSDRTIANRTRTVKIPGRTASDISERLRGTEFESVDEYVTFVLEQLLREINRPDTDDSHDDPESSDTANKKTTDKESDDAVADRLESLGYL